MNETENTAGESSVEPSIGRNEPCPCGSKKKYKRCCGVAAAPKLSTPKAPSMGGLGGMPGMGAAGGMPPGMDQMDPQMMVQFSQMLARLPKGQLQKLQSIMQKAMSGKDVTREAAALEASLPLEMQTMLQGMQGMAGAMGGAGGMPGMPGGMPDMSALQGMNLPDLSALGQSMDMPMIEVPAGGGMSEEEARRIVEEAAQKGEITAEQAGEVLADPGKGKGGFWKKMTGKK